MADKNLRNYTTALAVVLKIRPPVISSKKPKGVSATQFGALDVNTRSIWVRRGIDERDIYFAVAHEMRHLWQFEKHHEMFDEYQSNSVLSIHEYNLQPAELDANAFAFLIMRRWFGLEPLFNGLNDGTKQKIRARAKVIEAELAREEYE